MKKPRKQTRRGVRYRTLARGYKALKSPIAESLKAAAAFYDDAAEGADTNQNDTTRSAAPDRKKGPA